MSQKGIWSRIGSWFTGWENGGGTAVHSEAREFAKGNGQGHDAHGEEGGTRAAEPAQSSLLRFSRRDQAMEKLQDAYERVVHLVDSIHQHMQTQQERSQEMNHTLRTLADQAHSHTQAFSRMEQHLSAHAEQTRALAELPRIAESQEAAVTVFTRHLNESSNSAAQLAQSLSSFRETVSTVGEVAGAAAGSMQVMTERAAMREERMAVLFQEQTRRFTWFAATAIALALIATVIGLVAVLR